MKVSKEFWVNNSELEDIDKSIDCCIQLTKNRNMAYRNKITITYEIDREATIRESDIDNAFNVWGETGMDGFKKAFKQKLFGGGENEQ